MNSKITNSYLPELFVLNFKRNKPSMVTVNVTDRCNQQCVYCEIGKNIPSPAHGNLTQDDFLWIIDQMAIEKIPKISLCGGEPFLFEGLMTVVEYAGSKKIRTSITTNGMTVYKLTGSDVMTLKKYRTEINISMDSFDNEVNSTTRGSSMALENALRSIIVLREHKIPVTVLTAISKYNFAELADFVEKACHKGIRQVLFQPIIYYSNYPERQSIARKSALNVPVDSLVTLNDQLRQILLFEQKNPIKTNVYRILPWISHYLKTAAGVNGRWFFENVLDRFYCREIYAIIDIAYDGGIQPCGLRPASISVKDRGEKNLMELWLEATLEIRWHLESGKFYEECNGCCHHFSRNMLASMMKFPIANREAWMHMMPLFLSRLSKRILKKYR